MDTKEEQKKKQEAYLAAVAAEHQLLRRTVEAVLATEPGRDLFKYIHKICGFDKADRVLCSDGQVDLVATALNSERRNVYLNLRALAPAGSLRVIENPEEKI